MGDAGVLDVGHGRLFGSEGVPSGESGHFFVTGVVHEVIYVGDLVRAD